MAVAREEFSTHRIDKVVTCAHRDVCKDGFGDEVRGKADAVFLDLPHPWLVIDHSIDAIKSSGKVKICIVCLKSCLRFCFNKT